MKATVGILAAALLVVTGAACSSESPSVVRSGTTSAAASTPAGEPTDPLEGTWETDLLSPEDIVSAFEAAGGSEREGKAFFAQLGEGATTSAVITIKLLAGSWVEFETGDGGVTINGDQRTYELLGDGSLRLTTTDCVGTYTYREQGDRLTLQVVKQCSGNDAPFATTLYASFPFTRVS